MKTKLNITLSALIISLVMISVVSAFGVSSPYWNENPLTMARGETKVVNLNLQNMVGDEGVNVQAELIAGSEFTSLSKTAFVIEAGTSMDVPLKIKMPKDISPGESESITVRFKTVSEETGGIAMGTGMTISFNVIAGEEVVESNTLLITILVIIVLAIIIGIALKKKKRR